ncbi:MAG: LamG-like jellyroll fold domain-containing protein [Candidatus Bathyarchaeia archaeon]
MTNQGDRQAFFRAISGTSTDYNGDFLAAAATEGFTGEFNGVFIQWLQDRTGSSATNLDGLKQEFAELAGAHNWESTGGVPIILEGCQLWLDASDRPTVIESSDLVSQWTDKSGKDNDTDVQSTGTKQPTTNATTQNGKNILDFDGGDFFAQALAIRTIPSGNNTLFTIASTTNDTSNERVLFMGVGGGTRYGLTMSSNSGQVDYLSGTSGAAVSLSGVTKSDLNIYSCFRDGTTLSISLNGATAVTGTGGADNSSIDEASIGSYRLGVSSFLNGSIAEIIMYDRVLSSAEIASVETYLSNKWGVTLA